MSVECVTEGRQTTNRTLLTKQYNLINISFLLSMSAMTNSSTAVSYVTLTASDSAMLVPYHFRKTLYSLSPASSNVMMVPVPLWTDTIPIQQDAMYD